MGKFFVNATSAGWSEGEGEGEQLWKYFEAISDNKNKICSVRSLFLEDPFLCKHILLWWYFRAYIR